MHYIKALLSDGGVSEALEFVKSIYHPDMEVSSTLSQHNYFIERVSPTYYIFT